MHVKLASSQTSVFGDLFKCRWMAGLKHYPLVFLPNINMAGRFSSDFWSNDYIGILYIVVWCKRAEAHIIIIYLCPLFTD